MMMKVMSGGLNMPEDGADQDQDIDENDMDDEQKYKNWMENRPFLYDHLIVHKVDHPTLSIQWLPDKVESENLVNIKQRLIAGTFFQDEEGGEQKQNYLNIYSVILPKFKGFIELDQVKPPPENAPVEHRNSVKLEKQYLHEGEVNKAQYMPQNSKFIATKTNEGIVNIYDTDKPTKTGAVERLQGLNSSGFALNWNPLTQGSIASSGEDGAIAVWDYTRATQPSSLTKQYKCAVNVGDLFYIGFEVP